MAYLVILPMYISSKYWLSRPITAQKNLINSHLSWIVQNYRATLGWISIPLLTVKPTVVLLKACKNSEQNISSLHLTNRQSNTDFKTSNEYNVRGNTTELAFLAGLHCRLKIKSYIKLSAFNCSYAEVPAFFSLCFWTVNDDCPVSPPPWLRSTCKWTRIK